MFRITILRPVLADYLASNLRINSARTVEHYWRVHRQLAKFLGREPTLKDLTDDVAARFGRYLRGRVAAPTVNQKLHYLRAFWSWCADRGLVGVRPTFARLPEPHTPPLAWTMDQLRALLAACDRQPGWYGPTPRALWWRTIHYVWWDGGERTQATLALEWEHVDTERSLLLVPARIRKGRRAATYHLKPATVEGLEAIRACHPPRPFYWPYRNRATLWRHYRRIVAEAGLPYTVHKSGPQRMRRSFASHLEAAGGDATRALSHSSRKVTVDSYLDPSICCPVPENRLLADLR